MDGDEELEAFLERTTREHEELVFFASQGIGAECHWFFTQAFKALKSELYLPACTSFINGIEASLRVQMVLDGRPDPLNDLDRVKTLSNALLLNARELGLPIEQLAFPDEKDFEDKLQTPRKSLVHVEIVRVRHNLCLGNVAEFINKDLGEGNELFTQECCRDLGHALDKVSRSWVEGLGEFLRASA